MVAELLDQPAHAGLVAIGLRDQCARLIGHDQARHAADELQCADERADPVGRRLRRGGAGVGVVRRTQRCHEDLCGANLTGGRVDDGHRLAGVVGEELVAADVDLAHRALQAFGPIAVLDAEARVLVRQCVGLGVLLPQQLQRHAGALELLVDVGVVGLEVACCTRHRRLEQPRLELRVVEALCCSPVDAGGARQQRELAHGGLGHAQRTADLRVGEACLQVQAKNLSYLAHRDPGGGHRSDPQKKRSAYAHGQITRVRPDRPRSA